MSSDQDDLARAIALSLSLEDSSKDEQDLAAAMRLSMQIDAKNNSGPSSSPDHRGVESKQEREDRDFAMAMQLQEEQDQQQSKYQAAAKDRDKAASSRGRGGGGGSMAGMLGRFFGGGSSQREPAASSSASKACAECGNDSLFRPTLAALGRTYCVDCFRCAGCQQRFPDGRFYQHERASSGSAYCQPCLRELFGEKCCLCQAHLQGRYLRHNFFESEKYCLSHEDLEARRKCFSCSRLEPLTAAPFVELPDTRTCCLECLSSAVMTTDEALALYAGAVDFMEAQLGLPIPPGMREVPVMAVDVQSINEQLSQGQTTHGGVHGGPQAADYSGGGVGSVTRGLTLSRCGEVTHYSQGDMSFSFQGGFEVG